MCDYSLAELSSRLAVEGDELIVHRFPTGSVGLASASDLIAAREKPKCKKSLWQSLREFFELSLNAQSVPAVCVPPGATLTWKSCPGDLPCKWGLAGDEMDRGVRFVQTSADVNRYRDALELPNGRQILLQELPEGLRLQVSSFGGDQEGVDEGLLPTRLLVP